ncbi:MAG: purine-nucleoside phosphorylase [Desulfovibrionales bacterium]
MQSVENVQKAAGYVRSALKLKEDGAVGVVLGTGLGRWAEKISERSVEYADIPGFPVSTVQGHGGRLVHGKVAGREVLALQGRFHLYEGYSPAQVCFGVRTLHHLGICGLILTNAAGALNPGFSAGDLMGITDHINFTGCNPLTGPNVDVWGPRFPDMSRVYSPRLLNLARQEALNNAIPLERGVYLGLTGPCLETPAETRALRLLGADAVGMSTVLEAVAAHHMGIEMLGISCLTNKNLPDCMEETSLDDVLAQAAASSGKLERLLTAVIGKWPESAGK